MRQRGVAPCRSAVACSAATDRRTTLTPRWWRRRRLGTRGRGNWWYKQGTTTKKPCSRLTHNAGHAHKKMNQRSHLKSCANARARRVFLRKKFRNFLTHFPTTGQCPRFLFRNLCSRHPRRASSTACEPAFSACSTGAHTVWRALRSLSLASPSSPLRRLFRSWVSAPVWSSSILRARLDGVFCAARRG